MPIVDVQFVCNPGTDASSVSAQALADALGRVFGSAPGRTWVRLQPLPSGSYAENEVSIETPECPVFVTVLHAHTPAGEALARQVLAITEAVATCMSSPAERVHVQYAPAGAGRQAFGGKLIE